MSFARRLQVGLLFALLVAGAVWWLMTSNPLPRTAMAILQNADSIELYSLEPEPMEGEKPEKTLHDRAVLGKVAIDDAGDRAKVVAALKQGIGHGRGAKCFEPRHAIRASRAGKTVDVLICYECGWIYIYYDDQKAESKRELTDESSRQEFERLLGAGGVPLSKPHGSGGG